MDGQIQFSLDPWVVLATVGDWLAVENLGLWPREPGLPEVQAESADPKAASVNIWRPWESSGDTWEEWRDRAWKFVESAYRNNIITGRERYNRIWELFFCSPTFNNLGWMLARARAADTRSLVYSFMALFFRNQLRDPETAIGFAELACECIRKTEASLEGGWAHEQLAISLWHSPVRKYCRRGWQEFWFAARCYSERDDGGLVDLIRFGALIAGRKDKEKRALSVLHKGLKLAKKCRARYAIDRLAKTLKAFQSGAGMDCLQRGYQFKRS